MACMKQDSGSNSTFTICMKQERTRNCTFTTCMKQDSRGNGTFTTCMKQFLWRDGYILIPHHPSFCHSKLDLESHTKPRVTATKDAWIRKPPLIAHTTLTSKEYSQSQSMRFRVVARNDSKWLQCLRGNGGLCPCFVSFSRDCNVDACVNQ